MVQPTGTTSSVPGQAEQLTQRFLQISRQTEHSVQHALDRGLETMLHPLRTLLYELLIEPMVELWQRLRGLLYPKNGPGMTIGGTVLSSDLTDPAALPPRRSFPKP
jgi:hypothetical protein